MCLPSVRTDTETSPRHPPTGKRLGRTQPPRTFTPHRQHTGRQHQRRIPMSGVRRAWCCPAASCCASSSATVGSISYAAAARCRCRRARRCRPAGTSTPAQRKQNSNTTWHVAYATRAQRCATHVYPASPTRVSRMSPHDRRYVRARHVSCLSPTACLVSCPPHGTTAACPAAGTCVPIGRKTCRRSRSCPEWRCLTFP